MEMCKGMLTRREYHGEIKVKSRNGGEFLEENVRYKKLNKIILYRKNIFVSEIIYYEFTLK